MNEFEARLNQRFYQPASEEPEVELPPMPKKETYSGWQVFITVILIIAFVSFVVIFGYLAYQVSQDKFKSYINQVVETKLEPIINVTSNTRVENAYQFSTPVTNNYNFTIIIKNNATG